jgi:hyaluronoglucosaminidase
VAGPIPLRGVIEGFYGRPWSHAARLDAVAFLGARGFNAFVYAPKDDEKHRARWREPYDDDELARFADLATHCAAADVRFGFAISPGLDITYRDTDDRDVLLAKLVPLIEGGVDWFVLALDDIPPREGLASEQRDLAVWLDQRLSDRGDVRLSLVPTEYVGTNPSPYLTELVDGLPDDVDVMWTGPTVCSPTITRDDAQAWKQAVGGRPLVIWDNYPVNDTVMERELHLGPYRGRDPGLREVVDGVLCNPMIQARASLVPLATAAEFLSSPDDYDEAGAWERAICDVGGPRADALRALARACADGPLRRTEELPAHALVVALADELDGPGWIDAMDAVRDEFRDLHYAADAWHDVDDPLASELEPWLAQADRETAAGTAALQLLQQVRPVAQRNEDGSGKAAAPNADAALHHSFALLFAWTAAREADPRIVLGPRFALHPAVVQLSDGCQGLDVDLAVREDLSVIDTLCRIALDHYSRWTKSAHPDVRVMGADGEIAVDDDGSFRASPNDVVLLRSGPFATRAASDSGPPFRDARLP